MISLPSVRKAAKEQQIEQQTRQARRVQTVVAEASRFSFAGPPSPTSSKSGNMNRFSYAGPAYQPPRIVEPSSYGYAAGDRATHSYSSQSLASSDDEGDEHELPEGEWTSLWAGTALDDSVVPMIAVDHVVEEEENVEGSNTTLHADVAVVDKHEDYDDDDDEEEVVGYEDEDEEEVEMGMDEEMRLREWDRGVRYY